jgi:hypothetical protein
MALETSDKLWDPVTKQTSSLIRHDDEYEGLVIKKIGKRAIWGAQIFEKRYMSFCARYYPDVHVLQIKIPLTFSKLK